ncbi:hypothetical protein LXA43DRAFT_1104981 [Ganoderma leucocontextum]|nr:hypothetical protein LXA43DRAFT_1104981 [Ganoderma leucocontextum]
MADVPVLPLFTPLPFLITITMMTAPMTRAKALSQNKPIFPAPLQSHTDIHFRLCRNLVLCPEGFLWTTDEAVACFFGAGTIARDVVADVEYYLSLKVPFPGMGSAILLKVPVAITSGLNRPWLKSDLELQPQPQSQAQAEPKSES